jgi:2'-5' RNA ligase
MGVQTAAVTEHRPRLCDHWWPRPGWRPGRIALTWHLTFPDAPALGNHVAAYQRALDGLPGLGAVPAEWLHLTVQAIGYADEIPAPTVAAVVAAVRARVAALPPFELVFDRPTIYGEAIAIHTRPDAPVEHLRARVRAGIADVLGDVATAPEQAHGFLPHVTIAYSRIDADATPYAAALDEVEQAPTSVPVTEIALIRQERLLEPDWLYRWTIEAIAPLPA